MYWGGAAYFLETDRRLAEQHGLRLHDVIRRYVDCCFGQGDDAEDMMTVFDRIVGAPVFSDVYRATVARPGFPAWREALSWLEANPPVLDERGRGRSAGRDVRRPAEPAR